MKRAWGGASAVVVTVGLVVASFIGATLLSLARLERVGEDAASITEVAVPSLEELVRAASSLDLLRVRAEQYATRTGPEATAREELWQTVAELQSHVNAYISLPSRPEERAVWPKLFAAIGQVVAGLRKVVDARDAGDEELALRLATTELASSVERLDDLLRRSEELNAEEISDFTRRMEGVRRRAREEGLSLDALCVLLAGLLVARLVRSARREREVEARYAAVLRERAEEMELFSGRVAHDLLSPLSSTSLTFDLLARSGDAEVRRLAARGRNGVVRVRETVDGLLDFARAGARPDPDASSDLSEVAQEAVSGFQEQAVAAGVRLELSPGPALPAIGASRGVLLSIVSNLVQNALKYVGNEPEKRVVVRTADGAGNVRLEVVDTGPGIPEELAGRIFEPYFRAAGRSTAGLGLGLATVKRLVEAHGGRVGVAPAPGGGSLFWCELPARPGLAE